MPRESLRVHYPSSYDEEMEQLRLALEISARTSPQSRARETRDEDVTTSTGRGSGNTRLNDKPGRATRASGKASVRSSTIDSDDAAPSSDDRVTMAKRLVRRFGVHERDARRVVDVMDGDTARAEDVCLIVSAVKVSVDRAIAYLRDVGWDVELAMSRMLDASKVSPNAAEEREELKRRAESVRRVSGVKTDDSKTVRQNLGDDTGSSYRRTESGFSGASFRPPPAARKRDDEAERYHQERWEGEFAERAARATRAKNNLHPSFDGSVPPSNLRPHAREALRARRAAETPQPPRTPSSTSTELDPAALERIDLVDVLTTLGYTPSSSSTTAVRSAFRKAALRFHPDRHAGARDAHLRGDVWKVLTHKMDAYAH